MRSACKWKTGDIDPDSTTKRLWRSDVTAPRMLRIVEKTIRQTGDDHYGVVQQWWGRNVVRIGFCWAAVGVSACSLCPHEMATLGLRCEWYRDYDSSPLMSGDSLFEQRFLPLASSRFWFCSGATFLASSSIDLMPQGGHPTT